MSRTEQQIVRATVAAREARKTSISRPPASRAEWVSAGIFTAVLAATVAVVAMVGR